MRIDLKEWMGYWKMVKKAGYSDEDILDELEELEQGKGWIGFQNVEAVQQLLKIF